MPHWVMMENPDLHGYTEFGKKTRVVRTEWKQDNIKKRKKCPYLRDTGTLTIRFP